MCILRASLVSRLRVGSGHARRVGYRTLSSRVRARTLRIPAKGGLLSSISMEDLAVCSIFDIEVAKRLGDRKAQASVAEPTHGVLLALAAGEKVGVGVLHREQQGLHLVHSHAVEPSHIPVRPYDFVVTTKVLAVWARPEEPARRIVALDCKDPLDEGQIAAHRGLIEARARVR